MLCGLVIATSAPANEKLCIAPYRLLVTVHRNDHTQPAAINSNEIRITGSKYLQRAATIAISSTSYSSPGTPLDREKKFRAAVDDTTAIIKTNDDAMLSPPNDTDTHISGTYSHDAGNPRTGTPVQGIKRVDASASKNEHVSHAVIRAVPTNNLFVRFGAAIAVTAARYARTPMVSSRRIKVILPICIRPVVKARYYRR